MSKQWSRDLNSEGLTLNHHTILQKWHWSWPLNYGWDYDDRVGRGHSQFGEKKESVKIVNAVRKSLKAPSKIYSFIYSINIH